MIWIFLLCLTERALEATLVNLSSRIWLLMKPNQAFEITYLGWWWASIRRRMIIFDIRLTKVSTSLAKCRFMLLMTDFLYSIRAVCVDGFRYTILITIFTNLLKTWAFLNINLKISWFVTRFGWSLLTLYSRKLSFRLLNVHYFQISACVLRHNRNKFQILT